MEVIYILFLIYLSYGIWYPAVPNTLWTDFFKGIKSISIYGSLSKNK